MNYIRFGLSLSVCLACLSYGSTFVLMETGDSGTNNYINDAEHKLLFLVKFLEKIKALTNNDDTSAEISNTETNELSSKQDFTDTRDFHEPFTAVGDIEKKDYAILPPASEWCRMMGFRRCRGRSS